MNCFRSLRAVNAQEPRFTFTGIIDVNMAFSDET